MSYKVYKQVDNKRAVKSFLFLLLTFVCFDSLYAQSVVPPFKKGERVVFVGNSITHGGHYHSFIWLYYMTRFPDKPITIMNAGIGGESAWDIKDRLDYDVFDRNPTYVTLTFGMNDTGYDIYWKENAKELSEQRGKIIGKLSGNGKALVSEKENNQSVDRRFTL